MLPLQPPSPLSLSPRTPPSHPPPLLSCHVCKSEGFGGWHSDGVKPDGSHKAGDVAQSNEGYTHTHTPIHKHSLTFSLLNEQPWIIHHTHSHMHTHTSCRAHTQLLSATEGSATSLYFIIISLGIFLGCKGIPGGARPLKLSTPPPSSLPFPIPCTPPPHTHTHTPTPPPSESLSSSLNLFLRYFYCFFPFSYTGFHSFQLIMRRVYYRSLNRFVGGEQTRKSLPRGQRRIQCLPEPSTLLIHFTSSQGCLLSLVTQISSQINSRSWGGY